VSTSNESINLSQNQSSVNFMLHNTKRNLMPQDTYGGIYQYRTKEMLIIFTARSKAANFKTFLI